ncbi:FAD-dependent urate hydroxylase-like protein [Cladobotryum mycophilum]|uniref:FAD-dependent urate hydroxylase-like protein n=1 Tax=Cladobotryum mycophilum TaxID=491253 RepID=A0ABR0SRR4_9HYPO
MKVIIVGAGLGGLSAAHCFAKSGCHVELFERSPELHSRGGGISIRPSASRIMHTWGLEKDLESIAQRSPSVTFRNLESGDIASRTAVINASEYPDWGTTRKAVIRMLYKNAISAGAHIHFGATVVNVSDDDKQATVTLATGESIVGDIVLAADGVKSHIRPIILSDLDSTQSLEPIVDQTTFYGCDVVASDLTDDFESTSPKINRIGFLFAIQAETDQKTLWDEKGDIEHVRRFFSGSCRELTKALRLTDSCDRWRLVEMPNLPRWSSKAGRVILVGDSAHAMHPNAAQGYSTTVEDIGVLDFLLARFASESRAPVSQVVKIWQAIRKPRVERIKDYANWNTQNFSGKGVATPEQAEGKIIQTGKDVAPDMNADFDTAAFWKWSLDYDAIGEAQSALAAQPKWPKL